MKVCPTGTISEGVQGYRVQLGGKLGRHPQLAKELPGIYGEDRVLQIVNDCLNFYTQKSKHGERFGQILTSADFEEIAARYNQYNLNKWHKNCPKRIQVKRVLRI